MEEVLPEELFGVITTKLIRNPTILSLARVNKKFSRYVKEYRLKKYSILSLVTCGYQELLLYARKADGVHVFTLKACIAATRAGKGQTLKWLRKNGSLWNANICSTAAQYGKLDILKWALLNGCPWDMSTCEAAVKGRYIKVLDWLTDNNCPCKSRLH
jgi:hypothetical protein